MNKLLIVLSTMIISSSLLAQTGTIFTFDSKGEGLPYTHIKYQTSSKEGMLIADEDGICKLPSFEINEQIIVSLSFIGYTTITDTLYYNTNFQKKYTLFPETVILNDFVITGEYKAGNPEKAVNNISIISSKKIEQMGAVTINQVLSNELSIQLNEDNILGSNLSFQGLSGENVKILKNGIPVIGRLDGNIDLSQINLNNVERIEVIQGPLAVEYGTNALAGVINIITKEVEDSSFHANMNSYYENIGKYNLDGNITYQNRKQQIFIHGGRNFFDGWREDDPTFKERTPIADTQRVKTWKPKEAFFGGIDFIQKIGTHKIKYSGQGFYEKITNRGLPRNPYYEKAFDDYYYTTRIDNAITHEKKGDHHSIQTIASHNYFNRVKKTVVKDLTNLEEVLTTGNEDQDTTINQDSRIRSTFSSTKFNKVNFQIGVDATNETIRGEKIKNKFASQTDVALFSSALFSPGKRWKIKPGIRVAYNSSYDAPITPSLNIKKSVNKWTFRSSYARGFRTPSLKSQYLYFVDINHNIQGNESLKAERSHNFNLSSSYAMNEGSYLLKMKVAAYLNKIEDLITLAQVSNTLFSYVNIGAVQTHGAQFNTSISYIHFKLSIGTSINGSYFPDAPTKIPTYYSPEAFCNINYELKKQHISFSLFYKYIGNQLNYTTDESQEISYTSRSPFHLSDATMSKQFLEGKIQTTLGCKNLFNVTTLNQTTTSGAHGTTNNTLIGTGRSYFIKFSLRI